MAMNVSIMQCANCGWYIQDHEFITKFNSDEEMCRSVLMGYCCSKCGYMEEV